MFKFATRVLVSSAEAVLAKTGVAIEDVDVYVPHQANVRIIDHAVARLGIPEERVVMNVDRYGNTSSASIPLALADAVGDGRVEQGIAGVDDGHGSWVDVGLGTDAMDGGVMKIAFCFPGQGSLEQGMGRDIAEAVPEAMEVYERGSEASGLDLRRLCFDTALEEMVETEVQQPALVATSLAVLAALRLARREAGLRDRALGRRVRGAGRGQVGRDPRRRSRSSASAGSRWPRRRSSGPARWPRSSASTTTWSSGSAGRSSACGRRTTTAPARSSISGEHDAVDECCAAAEEEGARRTVKLKVSGAFHSPLVARAAERLRPAIERVKFARAGGGVHVHGHGPVRGRAADGRAARRPADRAGALHAGGLRARSRTARARSSRSGPGNVLSGLVKRIDRSVKAVSVNDLPTLEKIKEQLASA